MMLERRRPLLRAEAISTRRRHTSPSLPSVTLRVDARYDATPERVFDAWLNPDVARRWLFATASRASVNVAIDARVAGSFRFVERHDARDVEYRGEYVEIVPCCRLVFSLVLPSGRGVATCVSVDIGAQTSGCGLVLTHEHVPPGRAYDIEARWTGMLYGLGETLDAIGMGPVIARSPPARRGPLRRPALTESRLR